jgi:MFS family permease
MTLTQPLWILPIYLLLIGGSYYGAGPAMLMIVARMSSKLGKGEAFGYFMAVTSIVFSFSPLLFGVLADRIGLNLTMKIFSLPLLLGSAVLVLLYFVEKRYCLFNRTD